MDIGAWLREQGLQQYEPAFRANDIDADILPRLSPDDLTALGVTLVGHRRKLLDAIAALRGGTMPPDEKPRPDATTAQFVASEAERRQLTVMFCDLVGSTALASRLDPEDLRELIGDYHRCVTGIAGQFGGFVAKYMGDGVLVYFGYPQAHEDDAERAVQAGLALLPAVGKLQPIADVTLQTRIGIATGPVVVGDLLGSGAAQEHAVVGETPNLAARLQALAEPDTVVVGGVTRRLIGGLFECHDLGAVTLKGFDRPVPAWRVVGRSQVPGRFEALRGEALSPLTGRELELDQLTACWRKARDGHGQLVLISGEAGIGKSRLLQALLDKISTKAHVRLRYFCSPHHQSSPLHPFIEQLEQAAGFNPDDTAERKLEKIERLLAQGIVDIGAAALLIAGLLSIPAGDRYARLAMSAQRQKELTYQVLIEHLAGIAARQPVLMLFEDAHWIDPSSAELLRFLIEPLGLMPVLLLVTFRPDFTPPWPTASSTLLHLNRLDHGQSIAVVEGLTGDKPLPSQLLNQIVSRADGVPLFLEELTRTVLESGLLQDRGNRLELHGPLPPLAVPATLQDSLMARLDRLGANKEVGQIGAIIGREFSRELLAELAQRSEHELQSVLDQLVEAGLIQPQPTPLPAYSFKHALIQDAAYGSMLRDKRRMLHARLAAILERRFPDVVDTQPEMLAQHCAAARMPEKAVQYWQRAGERAAKRSANLEAVKHFQAGLALVNELSDKAMRAEQELRLLVALGPLLIITQGWQAPDVQRTYARARKLAEEGGRLADLFPVLWGLWLSCHAAVSPLQAVALVEELFELAGRLQDPEYLLQAHHAGCSTRHSLGQSMLALRHMDELLAIYKRDLHGHSSALYGGHDPAVCALGDRAEIEWLLGYPDRALATTDEGLALARALRHTGSIVHALWNEADLRLLRGEPDQVLMFAGELQSLASEHGLRRSYEGVALTFQGWVCAVRGARKDAISKLRIGTRLCQDYGSIDHDAGFLVRLATTYQLAGEAEAALKLVDDILSRLERLWERWVEPEVYRLKGEILRTLPNPDLKAAEESFATAIELARARTAKQWELRAAMGLARLWAVQDKSSMARDLLEPVYGSFTEGFDTRDLSEARRFLEELR